MQRAPHLLSYIQGIVDERRENGLFILTGSQHFGLLDAVSQSLAGRSSMLHLLPLELEELRRFPSPPRDLVTTLFAGAYPRIHEQHLPPGEWLASYTETYVERDVRQVLRVGDPAAFQTFLRVCAGRIGQLVNLSALGADCGLSHNTARAWLSVLEAGYIAYRLPPLHRNLGKRLVKTPKLYFYDSGLLCYLIGIREPDQLRHHPLRGAIFESWVVAEILKTRVHRGLPPDLFFFRDRAGTEVDLVLETGALPLAVEIKSGQTVAPDFFKSLASLADLLATAAQPAGVERVLVYGGEFSQSRSGVEVLAWSDLDRMDWARAGRPKARRRPPPPR